MKVYTTGNNNNKSFFTRIYTFFSRPSVAYLCRLAYTKDKQNQQQLPESFALCDFGITSKTIDSSITYRLSTWYVHAFKYFSGLKGQLLQCYYYRHYTQTYIPTILHSNPVLVSSDRGLLLLTARSSYLHIMIIYVFV